ncbi:MAG: peptide-methionine (S)-S-oxide reductase MsrA [Acidobacteriota bacterium]
MPIRRSIFLLFLGCLVAGAIPAVAAPRETALFAGGCFWCEETAFEGVPGVLSVTSGFTGGQEKNPTYELVSSGSTGHAESVEVVFDPSKITYERLLEIFWHNVDPLQANAQFCDHGSQYRSAIFTNGDAQRKAAEASKRKLEEEPRFRGKIVTQIVPAQAFYRAEEYHQDFYKKNPVEYHEYRNRCGRDARLRELWGDAAGGHQ